MNLCVVRVRQRFDEYTQVVLVLDDVLLLARDYTLVVPLDLRTRLEIVRGYCKMLRTQ